MEIPGTMRAKIPEKLSICSQTPLISLHVFLHPLGFILEGWGVAAQEKIKAVLLA